MGRLFKQYLEEDYGPKFACAQCNADVATYSDLIWEGFMGAQEPAYLFDNAMNLQPTSVTRQEVLSSGTYELADVSCRHCATALGWLYLSSSKEEQRYKEGKVLLAQSLLRRTCPGREDSVSSSELANIPGLRATAISSAAAMAAAVRFAQEIGQRQAQLEAEQQQQQQDEEGARQQLQALVREGQHQMTEQEEEEARLQPEEQGQSSLQQQVHAVAQEQRWALGHENTGEVAGLTPEQLQQLLHARLELAQQSEHLVQQQRRDLLFLRQQEERALQQREAAQQLQQQQGQGQGQDQPRRQHRAGGGACCKGRSSRDAGQCFSASRQPLRRCWQSRSWAICTRSGSSSLGGSCCTISRQRLRSKGMSGAPTRLCGGGPRSSHRGWNMKASKAVGPTPLPGCIVEPCVSPLGKLQPAPGLHS